MVTFTRELPDAEKPHGSCTEKCKGTNGPPASLWGVEAEFRSDQVPCLEGAPRRKRSAGGVRWQIDAGSRDHSSEGGPSPSAGCVVLAVDPLGWCPVRLPLGFLIYSAGAAAFRPGSEAQWVRSAGPMPARSRAHCVHRCRLCTSLCGRPALRASVSAQPGLSAASPPRGR